AMGFSSFVFLAIFCLARLFAAVGLWIKASWGAVLLVGATALELLLYVAGNADIRMGAVGFAVRIVLLASIILIFALSLRFNRAQADSSAFGCNCWTATPVSARPVDRRSSVRSF